VLELREVYKHYLSGEEIVRAVDGVSLTVSPGELVALYGPSGSGKTTLLLLAGGILPPDRGAILFAGREVARMSQRELTLYRRRELGFVFQYFHLQPGLSAIDNAAVKLVADGVGARRARVQVASLMERVGLASRAKHTPERLSAGECQRVALVRALANEPQLVLADEPTGNLDSERGGQVLALLSAICRERQIAVVLVTHDSQAAVVADRVLVLHDGRLREPGPEFAGEPIASEPGVV
jgi:ABC-type lipoprotein export system ATPase subunit